MATTSSKSKTGTVTSPEVDVKAREKLVIARIGLLLHEPFYGNLATRLELVNADEWLGTCAVDGRRFFYNSEFVNKLNPAELQFVFGHEVLHCAYDHLGRRGDRDPVLSNIAADYVVNLELVSANIGDQPRQSIVGILLDQKYKGMSYEQVYEHLKQNSKTINISILSEKVLDEHLDGSGEDGQPELSEEEKQQIRDEFREAVLSAAACVEAGKLPNGIKRLIANIVECKMNWRELLQQQIESLIKGDFTFARPSRRSWHMDAILPSSLPEKAVDVTLAIDLSGSITNKQVKDFFGEVMGIMQQFKSFRVGVMTFDTRVYNYQVFTEDNQDDVMNYEPKGGGGTDFMCVWEFLKESDIVPGKLIVMTDMEPYGSWGDDSYCDTIFLAHGSDRQAPFGITIKYE